MRHPSQERGDPVHRHLIIGGTTKAATTSLFFHLSDHPEVCASSSKETRFFLDPDYPLPSKYRIEDGLERYGQFFQECSADQVRMEATPDYLYSLGTAERIRVHLPHAKVVFSLRDPVTRLISWFRYARQLGHVEKTCDLEAFIRRQAAPAAEAPQHLRALRQGRYAAHVRRYVETFGADRVHILFQEDLARDPVNELQRLSTFAGIDPDFYHTYDFDMFNRTAAMRSPLLHRIYMKVRYHAGNYVHDKRRIRKLLRRLRLALEPLYHRLNARAEDREVTLSAAREAWLRSYYREDLAALTELIGRPPPWASRDRPARSATADDR